MDIIIINKNKEIEIFQLADEVKYTFTDINYLFVKENEGNLRYTTSSIEEFLKHLSVYNLNDIPFRIKRFLILLKLRMEKLKALQKNSNIQFSILFNNGRSYILK